MWNAPVETSLVHLAFLTTQWHDEPNEGIMKYVYAIRFRSKGLQ